MTSKHTPWAHVDKQVLSIAHFLRSSSSNLKLSNGVLQGRRVDFFKGKAAINALMRETYSRTTKKPPLDLEQAKSYLNQLLDSGLFVRVERTTNKKILTPAEAQIFAEDFYYTWIYMGSQVKNQLIGIGILLICFIGVLFPLWPDFLRTGVYYLSLGLLGLMGAFFGLAIVRLFIWLFTILAMGKAGWLYPNLFADCGVLDSFRPVWAWEEKAKPKSSSKSDSTKKSE